MGALCFCIYTRRRHTCQRSYRIVYQYVLGTACSTDTLIRGQGTGEQDSMLYVLVRKVDPLSDIHIPSQWTSRRYSSTVPGISQANGQRMQRTANGLAGVVRYVLSFSTTRRLWRPILYVHCCAHHSQSQASGRGTTTVSTLCDIIIPNSYSIRLLSFKGATL